MKTQKVIIAHKNKLQQLNLASAISILDCEVSKTLSSGIRTLRYILREKPDIAILQSSFRGISAFEIIREITSKKIRTKCIVIFEKPTYENLLMARSFKIEGCFCETETKMEILSIVHSVLRNQNGYCDYLLGDEKDMDALINFEKLSFTEIKIMTLLGFYKNKKKVAIKLDYSSKKIETLIQQIASKLDIEPFENVLTILR